MPGLALAVGMALNVLVVVGAVPELFVPASVRAGGGLSTAVAVEVGVALAATSTMVALSTHEPGVG